jgi:hypothetical protein
LLRLKADGEWSSVTLVGRYAHLMPAGQVKRFIDSWGCNQAAMSETDGFINLYLMLITPLVSGGRKLNPCHSSPANPK